MGNSNGGQTPMTELNVWRMFVGLCIVWVIVILIAISYFLIHFL